MNTLATYRNGQRGFIALTAVLIMTSMLMVLMYVTGASSFYARFDALNSEYKRISVGLSEACSNAALLKIAQNYNYIPSVGGEVVPVGTDECRILSVAYTNPVLDTLGNETGKTATIRTNAKFPLQNGSWSTHQVVAKVTNPSYMPVAPPTCSFVSNTNSIYIGQSVTLSWSTAGNVTSFKVERNVGGVVTYPYPSGPVILGPITDSPPDSATYTGTITGPGGSTQCVSPRSVVVQPSLSCADTVMMLDRTGTIFSAGANIFEQNAAKALISLYNTVSPAPKLGIGRFGDEHDNGVEAEIVPIYVPQNTGFLPPTSPSYNVGWTNPDNAFLSDNSLAVANADSDIVQYSNFNIPVIPSGSIITGIEVQVEGYTTNSSNSRQAVIDLSWNGGSTYTSGSGTGDKTTNMPGSTPSAEGVRTFGGSSDTWGRAWLIDNFTNANFRIRLNANSSSGSLNIDQVRVRVHYMQNQQIGQLTTTYGTDELGNDTDADLYRAVEEATNTQSSVSTNLADAIDVSDAELNSVRHVSGRNKVLILVSDGLPNESDTSRGQNSDPAIAASNSANVARSGVGPGKYPDNVPTEIFTIHFGDPSGRTFLASIATPGAIIGNTGFLPPTSPSYNVGWTNPDNAFLSDNSLAVANADSDIVQYSNFNIPVIPSGSIITGIEVQVEGYTTNSSNSRQAVIDLSWNGGSTYTSGSGTGDKTTNMPGSTPSAEGVRTFGGSSDTWGRAWLIDNFTNANFRIRLNANSSSGSLNIDQVRVMVHYMQNSHSFISTSPTGDDMPGIFDTIGKLACLAAVAPPPPTPPPPPPPPPPPSDPVFIGSWDEITII